MRKIVPIGFVLSLFLTSCIEIIEEITVKPDQSGTISYSIHSDPFTSLLSGLSGMLDRNVIQEKLSERFEEFAGKFKNTKGINNVKFTVGDNITDVSLSFDFTNTKDLNAAMYEIAGSKKTFFSPSYLKIGKHKLKKFNIAPYLKKQLKNQDIIIPDELIGMIEVKSIYNMPHYIKSAKGESVSLAERSKTTTQKFEFADIYNNKTNTSIKIKY